VSAATKQNRRRHRGAQKTPTKQPVSVRLNPAILVYYRDGGPGWQTRMNDDLMRIVQRSQKGGR
jgi:uncharacterized protein (DUF4415 family)